MCGERRRADGKSTSTHNGKFVKTHPSAICNITNQRKRYMRIFRHRQASRPVGLRTTAERKPRASVRPVRSTGRAPWSRRIQTRTTDRIESIERGGGDGGDDDAGSHLYRRTDLPSDFNAVGPLIGDGQRRGFMYDGIYSGVRRRSIWSQQQLATSNMCRQRAHYFA